MPPETPDWTAFIELTIDGEARPHLMKAATLLRRERREGELLDALDLGCGAGRDAEYLLRHDFRVTAVDSAPAAASVLRRLPRQRRLRFVESPIESFPLETYDLVSAQYVLPFLARERFGPVVRDILGSLRPGGVLACNFFGVDDQWNQPGSTLNFVTRADVEHHLAGLAVVSLEEHRENGRTADGTPKHWHLFHVIARRAG